MTRRELLIANYTKNPGHKIDLGGVEAVGVGTIAALLVGAVVANRVISDARL